MRDGPTRRVVKWLARCVMAFDLRATRALQQRPRYRLSGSCNGCGRCCEAPTIRVRKVTQHLRVLRATTLWWHRVVNGFELTQEDKRFGTLTFRCTHYDAATKQCDSYESRPMMCRDYPTNLTHEANPVVFDECGYRFVDVNAQGLRAALAKTSLSAEQREALEQKLNLRE